MADAVPARSEMGPGDQWDIARMYADEAAWEADFSRIDGLMEPLRELQGKLSSAEAVCTLFTAEMQLDRLLEKLYVFAHLQEDQDTGNTVSQTLMARIRNRLTEVETELAWVTPEILGHDVGELNVWAASPQLADYRYSMEKLIRRKAHTLSEVEETLLSGAGEILSAPSRIYSMLTNADLTFPAIANEDDEQVEMSDGRYSQFLRSTDRRVRKDAFDAMYSTYSGVKNTVATTLGTTVKLHNYSARVRHYPSALEASLYGDQIPAALYDSLITAVHEQLPRYVDYLELRARKLGLDALDMYDLYVPIVPDVEVKVPFEQAKDWVIAACAPLGEDYVQVLRSAFADRWMDVYENRGKRSGAYSSGCYDSLPYVLLNYQGTLNDVFTLAHELGHSMHTWLANQTQPPQTAHYPIFIAEIASTLNEELLLQYLLKQTSEPAMRAYLLNHYCDSFKGTVYRQTMFAEYEKRIHELDAEGQALTHDALSSLYAELNQQYFPKYVKPDEQIRYEWARIPHFYYNFYVYKYATSFCASQIFAQRVQESPEQRDKYLQLLKNGGSAPPLELIQQAGVDLLDAATINDAFVRFGEAVNELSGLLQ